MIILNHDKKTSLMTATVLGNFVAGSISLLAREHHTDKVSSEEEMEASEKYFIELRRARDVVLDSDMRHKYDQWRDGFRMWINFEDWLKM